MKVEVIDVTKRIRGLYEADEFQKIRNPRSSRGGRASDGWDDTEYDEGVKSRKGRSANKAPVVKINQHGMIRSYSMKELPVGTIVVTSVAFSDGSGVKSRPVVVCEVARKNVWVLPITSAVARFKYPGVDIAPNEANGVSRDCRVQGRVVCINRGNEIEGLMGHLDVALVAEVLKMYDHLSAKHASKDEVDCCLCDRARSHIPVAEPEKVSHPYIPSPTQVMMWIHNSKNHGKNAPGFRSGSTADRGIGGEDSSKPTAG